MDYIYYMSRKRQPSTHFGDLGFAVNSVSRLALNRILEPGRPGTCIPPWNPYTVNMNEHTNYTQDNGA
ncbi:hypothetical protein PM082_006082 [Marasmius tenuissimus]|nr:hypothetical protein PM082_006082 [Marasmius tenuissimus]